MNRQLSKHDSYLHPLQSCLQSFSIHCMECNHLDYAIEVLWPLDQLSSSYKNSLDGQQCCNIFTLFSPYMKNLSLLTRLKVFSIYMVKIPCFSLTFLAIIPHYNDIGCGTIKRSNVYDFILIVYQGINEISKRQHPPILIMESLVVWK